MSNSLGVNKSYQDAVFRIEFEYKPFANNAMNLNAQDSNSFKLSAYYGKLFNNSNINNCVYMYQ